MIKLEHIHNLIEEGKINLALSELDHSIHTQANDTTLTLRASLYIRKRKFDLAKKDLAAARVINDDNPDIYFYLGVIERKHQQYQQAIFYLKRTLELNIHHSDAYFEIGSIYIKTRQYAEAELAIKQALRLSPKNYIYYAALSGILMEQGNEKEALECAQFAQKISPHSQDVLHALGNIYMKKGRISESIILLKKLVSLYPKCDKGFALLAESYQKSKHHKQAIQAITTAIGINANNSHYHFIKSDLEYNSNNFNDALTSICNAININFNITDYYTHRGKVLYALKEYKKSLQDFQLILERCPNDITAKYYLSLLSAESKDYSLALNWINSAMEHATHIPELFNQKAFILNQLERFEEAQEAFLKALELSPHNGRFEHYFAQCLEKQGNLEEAEDMYLNSIVHDKHLLENYSKLEAIYNDKKDYDKVKTLKEIKENIIYKRLDPKIECQKLQRFLV